MMERSLVSLAVNIPGPMFAFAAVVNLHPHECAPEISSGFTNPERSHCQFLLISIDCHAKQLRSLQRQNSLGDHERIHTPAGIKVSRPCDPSCSCNMECSRLAISSRRARQSDIDSRAAKVVEGHSARFHCQVSAA